MVDAPIVAVRGEAVHEVAPELARFSVSVSARDPDRQTTLERLARRTAAIRAVLDGYGPAIERRETDAVQVHPERKGRGERIAAYVASLGTTVTVTDFTVLGELLLRLADEDQTSVYGPWWELRPGSEVHRTARRAAVDDAVHRAGEYAAAVGSRLDRLLAITDAGLSGPPPPPGGYAMRAMAQSYGGGDGGPPELNLEPQRQTIMATVEMRFTITGPTALPTDQG